VFTTDHQQRSIALEDGSGSVMELDSHSSLREWQVGSSYYAELLKGQAVFTMKPNRARWFHVLVGKVEIRDVGTIFAVRLGGEGEILVTVAEGVVQLLTPHEPDRYLRQNQQASIGSAVSIQNIPPEEVARRVSKSSDTLMFQSKTVDSVVKELNLHNRTQLEVADPAIANLAVSGQLYMDEPSEFTTRLVGLHPDIVVLRCKSVQGSTVLRLQYKQTASSRDHASQSCIPYRPSRHQ